MTVFRSASGNAFVYVLVAVALFAGLSFVLSRSNDGGPQTEISEAQAQSAAASILGYAAQAQSAVDQMVMNGTAVDDIDFMLPSDANFNSGDTFKKLFHPDGGGLQYKSLPEKSIAAKCDAYQGYYVGRFNNWEWTPSSSQDVLFTACGISKAVCSELNRKLTGNSAIPTFQNGDLIKFIIDAGITGVPNINAPKSMCPACDGKPAFCVIEGDSTPFYAFYSILVAR